MTTYHRQAQEPGSAQAPRRKKPVGGWRRLARLAAKLFSGLSIGLVIGASFLAGTGPLAPPSQPPAPAETRQRVSPRSKLDLETTDWGTAKKLVAFLLNRSPHEINAREAWAWLWSGKARRAYRDNRDQITWAEAKEVIADLLGVAKDTIDEKERLQGIEELAGLTALAVKRGR